MTKSIIYSIDGAWHVDDQRQADVEGGRLIARSRRICLCNDWKYRGQKTAYDAIIMRPADYFSCIEFCIGLAPVVGSIRRGGGFSGNSCFASSD